MLQLLLQLQVLLLLLLILFKLLLLMESLLLLLQQLFLLLLVQLLLLHLSLVLTDRGVDGDDPRGPWTGGSPGRSGGSRNILATKGSGTLAGVEGFAEGRRRRRLVVVGGGGGSAGVVARQGVGLARDGRRGRRRVGGGRDDTGGYGGVGSAILHHTPAHALTAATTVHTIFKTAEGRG